MEKFLKYKINNKEAKLIKGGITYCEFLDMINYLNANGQGEQAGYLMERFNHGYIDLEDWNYNGNPPSC